MIVPFVSREEQNNWTHEKWHNSVMKFCTGFQFETKKTLAALKQNAEYMAGGDAGKGAADYYPPVSIVTGAEEVSLVSSVSDDDYITASSTSTVSASEEIELP